MEAITAIKQPCRPDPVPADRSTCSVTGPGVLASCPLFRCFQVCEQPQMLSGRSPGHQRPVNVFDAGFQVAQQPLQQR